MGRIRNELQPAKKNTDRSASTRKVKRGGTVYEMDTGRIGSPTPRQPKVPNGVGPSAAQELWLQQADEDNAPVSFFSPSGGQDLIQAWQKAHESDRKIFVEMFRKELRILLYHARRK